MIDQGENDGKIVRELYARDNSIISASECQTCAGKFCFMMIEESMALLKLMLLSLLCILRAEAGS